MIERSGQQAHPVAIGGLGGSGTRLGAALLQLLGYYIGDDLNETLDNLWFTLLFKRRSILMEFQPVLCSLVSSFFSRMSGHTSFSEEQRARVIRLAHDGRLQHSQEWLQQRADSFLSDRCLRDAGQPWGWKEPNTHIIIEHLIEILPDLRYIHFTRHPIDMSLSANQNQLRNWGPIILNRDVVVEPRDSLSYWCAAHRRMDALMRRWPQHMIVVDFDALCADPESQCARIASFLGVGAPSDVSEKLGDLIDRRRAFRGRLRRPDLTQYLADDIIYVRELGYVL